MAEKVDKDKVEELEMVLKLVVNEWQLLLESVVGGQNDFSDPLLVAEMITTRYTFKSS